LGLVIDKKEVIVGKNRQIVGLALCVTLQRRVLQNKMLSKWFRCTERRFYDVQKAWNSVGCDDADSVAGTHGASRRARAG
jgi:hypothetical protein